jgi:hypothetical protein
MQTSNEIKSGIENFTYYANEIQKLTENQLNIDWKRGEELKVNIDGQSIRFEALTAIHTACDAIKMYVANIETNLKYCEAQDKILYKPEEET